MKSIGETLTEKRHEIGVSVRTLGRMSKAIRDAAANCGAPLPRHNLSRNVVSRNEQGLRQTAVSLNCSVEMCVKFLLHEAFDQLPDNGPAEFVIVSDGYSPNPLNSSASRFRVAIGLVVKKPHPLITLLDAKKEPARAWCSTVMLEDLRNVGNCIFHPRDKKCIRPVFKYLAGDHAELWANFQGMGGTGHRSAFCSHKMTTSAFPLHCCQRRTILQLHSDGFPCSKAHCMDENAYTITPPLHDCKGLAEVILSHSTFKNILFEKVFGKSDVNNFTAKQGRELMRHLQEVTCPTARLQAHTFAMIVSFRYNDGNILHWKFGESKLFLFGLFSFHLLCVTLDTSSPGCLCGPGAAYIHSTNHSFDREDQVPFSLLDEGFERENGARKRWHGRSTGSRVEVDLLMRELATRVCPVEEDGEAPSYFGKFDELVVCLLCFGHPSWEDLQDRLCMSGLGAHVRHDDSSFAVSWEKSEQQDHNHEEVLRICTCLQRKLIRSSGEARAATPPRKKRIAEKNEEAKDEAQSVFATAGYASNSTRFQCSHCFAKFGQKKKLEMHLENCAEYLKTQSRLDFKHVK